MMSLEQAFERTTAEERERSFVITDPSLEDNPIVFVNDAFTRVTGYARDEILGRNCRFLQGAETDPKAVAEVRRALARAAQITIDLLNYRKDGTPFWNRLRIKPIFADDGTVESFVGFQNPIDAAEVRSEPFFRIWD